MGNGKGAPDTMGKKRKQEAGEGATPVSKRVKKEIAKSAGLPNKAAAAPDSTQKSGKGENFRRASVHGGLDKGETIEGASTGPESQTPDVKTEGKATATTNANGEQHRYSKKQWKQLKKAEGGSASPVPVAKPVESPAPVTKEKAPLDEANLQKRKAEKRARKRARRSDLASVQDVDSRDSVQSPKAPAIVAAVASQKKPQKAVMKTEEQDQHSSAKWTMSDASAGRYIEHDPVFVADSNGDDFLVAATAHEVQILSLETSLPAHTLQMVGDSTVVGFAKEPGSSAVSIIDDRRYLTTWDWEHGESTRVKGLKNGSPLAYAAGSQAVSKTETRTIRAMVHHTHKSTSLYVDDNLAYKTQIALDSVHITGEGQYIVAHGADAIVLGKRKKDFGGQYLWAELPLATKITCAHSELRLTKGAPGLRLVVGLANGQLHLYDDVSPIFEIKDGSKLPSPRVLHWHRDAVSSVKFSADSRYLISGGKETVLVLWQLETGKTQFLPHLTSEVERVVVSSQGDRYAVQMGDNSIMVLSTSELKPVANFAGLQLPLPVRRDRKGQIDSVEGQDTTALLHPTQPDQLLLAVPATQPISEDDIAARPFLQAFDLRTSRHVIRQALTRNNVTDFNLSPEQTPIIPPDVCHAAVSQDGQWLATVDEWVPPESDVEHLVPDDDDQTEQEQLKRKEVYLKIWQWDAAHSLWTLTTRVDAPHDRASEENSGAGSIYALVASPTSRGFATVGEDSAVKFWKPKTRMRHGVPLKDEQGNDLMEWTCRRTTQLERQLARTDSPLEDEEDSAALISGPSDAYLAFSEDGSTLAAAMCHDILSQVPALHLIDALTGEVKHVKDNYLAPELAGLGFLDRHLIALSRETLLVWDVVSDSLVYQITLPPTPDNDAQPLLAVNPHDRTFAIALPQSGGKGKVKATVEVYNPTQPDYLHKQDLSTPLCALLATPSKRGYVLLFADATTRTLAARRTTTAVQLPATIPELPPPTPTPTTAVPDLLLAGRGANKGLVLEETEDDRPVVRPEDLAGLFDTGLGRVLPSVRDMWRGVVELYGRRPRVEGAGGEGMEVDG